MTAYLIASSFLISLLSLYFFIAVFFKGVRDEDGRNLSFCFFSLSIFIWAIAHMMWLLSDNPDAAILWLKVLVVGSIFIPYAYFHFTVNLTGYYHLRRFARFGYVLAFILVIMNLGDFVVKGVEPHGGFPYWPVPGSAFPAYFGGFLLMSGFGIYLLFRKYRNAVIETKNQLKFILLGTGIGFAGGATNFFLWVNIDVPPFGHGLVIFYTLGIGYSMLKYRTLDFNEMIFRIFGVLVASIILSGFMAVGLVALLSRVYSGFYPSSLFFWWTACLILSLVLFALGIPFFEFFNRTIYNRFLTRKYNYRSRLRELSEKAALGVDTDASMQKLIEELVGILGIDAAAFYIRSEFDSNLRCKGPFGKRAWPEELASSEITFLFESIKHQPGAFLLEEFSQKSKNFEREIKNFCTRSSALSREDLIVPVCGLHEVLGFLVLGMRRRRPVSASVDFLLLENFCSQIGLALKFREFERMTSQVEKLVSLGTMAAGLSHELKNPLVSIQTLSGLLEQKGGQLNITEEFRQVVQRDVRRIFAIIEGVSEFSREAGRPLKPVDLSAVIHEARDAVDAMLQARRVECNVHIQSGLPEPIGHFDQLVQVFKNLIENAANAIAEWDQRTEVGKIDIKAQVRDYMRAKGRRWIEVSVRDNGPGIPKDFQKHVFDPFVTSRDTGERASGAGTGLGLAIVTKIIEKHSGLINVNSAENRGAEFRVNLPFSDSNSA